MPTMTSKCNSRTMPHSHTCWINGNPCCQTWVSRFPQTLPLHTFYLTLFPPPWLSQTGEEGTSLILNLIQHSIRKHCYTLKWSMTHATMVNYYKYKVKKEDWCEGKVHSIRGNLCRVFVAGCPSCCQSILMTSTGTHPFSTINRLPREGLSLPFMSALKHQYPVSLMTTFQQMLTWHQNAATEQWRCLEWRCHRGRAWQSCWRQVLSQADLVETPLQHTTYI